MTPKDGMSLEDRVEKLEKLVATLSNEIGFVRGRLSSFFPERHHCPKCGATIHKQATACRSCGGSWGKKVDPNAGLPGR